MKRFLAPAMLLPALALASCTALSPYEKGRLAELEYRGIPVPREEVKSPVAAGALNVLPGFGNFYLAMGTNESEQWLYGLVNVLTWPVSIIWGIPEAAIDAKTINKRYTIYYYTFGPGKDMPAPPEPKREPFNPPENKPAEPLSQPI